MFQKDKLSDLLEDRVTVGKGLEGPLKAARAKTQAEPFSLESLIAWLGTKDADTEYDYDDFDNCLVAQYTRQLPGIEKPYWRTWYGFGSDNISNHIRATVSVPRPWTMGAALDRARALALQANAVSGSSPILISEGV